MESNEHMIDEILRHLDSELEHGLSFAINPVINAVEILQSPNPSGANTGAITPAAIASILSCVAAIASVKRELGGKSAVIMVFGQCINSNIFFCYRSLSAFPALMSVYISSSPTVSVAGLP